MRRKWYLPLAMLGLGSLGALALSDAGRRVFRRVAGRLGAHPDETAEWEETAEREVERLQSAVDEIAEKLQTAH